MKPLAQINVIPFIDIMLVLLAVVLTTATFVAQGKIPVNLPSATRVEPIPQIEHVKITIDESGVIYLDEQTLTLDHLNARVATLTQASQNTRFLLHVDKNTAFQYFVGVVDLLKKYDVEDVSIVIERQ
uniref:Biopolymer transport protein ExbD n=2 Tax=unclassified Candidatus Kentrum TaxID=2643149 RepID=A0A451AQZ3_9GAMM|nr:MAG: biopolymer transport protein ExbD [Candidatus Kentron sp. UNK]VFK73591.1 MAG: biopolymer transport protein ExbD [Candidatus Kentron sp. UNK]VFK77791.1 MAG: biopolymer transport protein ExbD [Candidatus Kentron sp. SD]